MTFEDKAEIVISQLRQDRDRLLKAIEDIKAEVALQKKGFPPSSDYYKAITRAVNIIDKHIST